jgi:prepilin-type N-terminal cleavage/methylation domain-containing protein
MRKSRTGFTIVELMILLAIIGILVMIATPYYIKYAKSARKSACITNMKKIEGAVMLAKMSGIATPVLADIVGPTSHLKEMPTCPSNDQPYTVIDPPTCPSGDTTHVIPPEE